MKNVFLIGNGFDLHHMLPTQYYDFMCVANYLKNHHMLFPITIGEIFSKCTESENIKKSYDEYKKIFNSTEIKADNIIQISDFLHDNVWFNYFLKTLNKNLGWIDFEKEIFTVINTLYNILKTADDSLCLPRNELLPPFILLNFSFFVVESDKAAIRPGQTLSIKEEYLVEQPFNSRIYVVDKKKIFDELYKYLLDFNRALNLYFHCFVENALELLSKNNKNKIDLIGLADISISFNYTSTLEVLYSAQEVFHIHGKISDENLVLGVNPNEADDIGTKDTALIKFKKYYQREKFGTDIEYINWYRTTIGKKAEYRIVVIGHSLDETDSDIISDMFLNAKEIYISYYNDKCKDDYVANLTKMFGANGFDRFRKEKQLQFVSLSEINALMDELKPEEIKWEQTASY